MEVKKQRFINYIDNKRTNKILRDVAEFLEFMKDERMEIWKNASKQRGQFWNFIQPNLILTGWRGWWSMISYFRYCTVK